MEENISNTANNTNDIIQEEPSNRGIYYCFLCGADLDANKCCTDEECPIYGIPQ